MPGVAIITESCIDTKDRACVDVCPVQCIDEPEEQVPDGSPNAKFNATDPNKGHDHTFFTQLSRDVFADRDRHPETPYALRTGCRPPGGSGRATARSLGVIRAHPAVAP